MRKTGAIEGITMGPYPIGIEEQSVFKALVEE